MRYYSFIIFLGLMAMWESVVVTRVSQIGPTIQNHDLGNLEFFIHHSLKATTVS